jgi:hypothetical protein
VLLEDFQMSKTLYFYHHPDKGISFGVKPILGDWNEYHNMSRKIGLKDFGWDEVRDLQKILGQADFWEDFPAIGLTVVGVEFKAGDEEQRIDILYLRSDGALLPCELKIGGQSKDTHGQLIRYIADLQFQSPNFKWVEALHRKYVAKINGQQWKRIHARKFEAFIAAHKIKDKFIRVLPQSGIIIDEEFPSQLLKAVRHLNDRCGFSIRLIQARAYTTRKWKAGLDDFKFRLDFEDIQ